MKIFSVICSLQEKINGDFAEEMMFKDSLTALTFKHKNHKILKRRCLALCLILFCSVPEISDI